MPSRDILATIDCLVDSFSLTYTDIIHHRLTSSFCSIMGATLRLILASSSTSEFTVPGRI